MTANTFYRPLQGAVIALLLAASLGSAPAQQPSPGALAAARELMEMKGAVRMFEPIVPGVIEQAKSVFLQTNPQLSKELNDVAAALRTEFAAKRNEILDQVARVYAGRFTEQEIKDTVTFYKTPLGKKLLAEEPVALDQSMSQVQQWANRFSEDVMTKFRAEMRKKGHNL